jgi:hypothetical protein
MGAAFCKGVVTCDGLSVVVLGIDKVGRDLIYVYHTRTGVLATKIPLKQSAVKVRTVPTTEFCNSFTTHSKIEP